MDLASFYNDFNYRLRGPFYATYLTSFLIFNWEIIFIAFGDQSTSVKIDSIKLYIHDWCHFFILPLGVALMFFLAYRWVEVYAERYLDMIKRKRKEFKTKHNSDSYFTGEEYLQKIKEIENAQEYSLKLRDQVSTKNDEIIDLMKGLATHQKKYKKLESDYHYEYGFNNALNLEGDWIFGYKSSNSPENTFLDISIKVQTLPNHLVFEDTRNNNSAIFNSIVFQQSEKSILIVCTGDYTGRNHPRSFFILDLQIADVRFSSDGGRINKMEGKILEDPSNSRHVFLERINNHFENVNLENSVEKKE